MGSRNTNTTEMQSFLSKLPSQSLEPLWSRMSDMVPARPNPRAVPHMWAYEDAYPLLVRAGEVVPEELAERRVLMLVNPSMEAPCTTDTIYGGLQVVNPGEVAPAHRHVAYACRFIIEGEGFTAVEGKKMPLRRGDVVVTPSWHWHDHGNESDSRVIWLDVLNLPLFQFARVNFAEGYEKSRYPSEACQTCEWRHPWASVQKALGAQVGSHAAYDYCTEDGKPLSTTIGVRAERISVGTTTDAIQDTCSYIFHCFQGSGVTSIETSQGTVTKFNWVAKDTFAVPAGSRIQHHNTGDTEAYLVSMHDGPLLDNLGLRRRF